MQSLSLFYRNVFWLTFTIRVLLWALFILYLILPFLRFLTIIECRLFLQLISDFLYQNKIFLFCKLIFTFIIYFLNTIFIWSVFWRFWIRPNTQSFYDIMAKFDQILTLKVLIFQILLFVAIIQCIRWFNRESHYI